MAEVQLPPGDVMGTYHGKPLIRYTADQMYAHAAAQSAADNAELRKQVRMLRRVVDGAAAVEEFGTTAQARARLGKMARSVLRALEIES